jgi:anti-sigma regulatory factor (Ser/Thr protein kinase)
VVTLDQQLTTPGADDMRWLRVADVSAVAACRRAAAAMAGRLGFPATRTEQLALAVTEAASNLHKHAREGSVLLRICRDGGISGVELIAIDAGPGVPDLAAAQRDGHSTTGTLGVGLGSIRRMADSSGMYSAPGRVTALAARFWPHPHRLAGADCAGLNRPITGETECGDVYWAGYSGRVLTGALCDGLGHGPLAAAAAREAIAAVSGSGSSEPAAQLERAHRRMAGTRGGALAIVAIEGSNAAFAGLGNIAGWVLAGETRSALVSLPGIAGHQARAFRQQECTLPEGAAVVLHSDGLTSRWDTRSLPGLAASDALVMAAALLGDAAVRRDDASVLVLKQ